MFFSQIFYYFENRKIKTSCIVVSCGCLVVGTETKSPFLVLQGSSNHILFLPIVGICLCFLGSKFQPYMKLEEGTTNNTRPQ